MSKPLIVIGVHKQELEFGKLLDDHIKKNSALNLSFHQIRNECSNFSNGGTEEDQEAPYKEIRKIMMEQKPPVTISIHTGEGWQGIHRAEIYTNTQYSKIKSIEDLEPDIIESEMHSERSFIFNEGSICVKFIAAIFIPYLPTYADCRLPFMDLEVYIPIHNRLPYKREVIFTTNTIEKICGLYKNK